MLRSIFFITFALFLHSATIIGANIVNGENHEVRARKGDGITILLQRYELHRDNDLRSLFLKLNNIEENQFLIHRRLYTLPVRLFNYDGKSIRSTIDDQDWDKAVRIKKYNETLLAKGARSTHYSKSKILWVPSTELLDTAQTTEELLSSSETNLLKNIQTPVKENISLNKIYGKTYKLDKKVDNSLKRKVYYIVSGHGGPDPGAQCKTCKNTLCEDEYAYDVSLRLARRLEEHGAIVEMVIQDKNDGIRDASYLPCDKDERLANGDKLPANQMKRLIQRTNYINKKHEKYKRQGYKDQVVVSIHVDSNSKSTQQDVFFCYYRHSEKSRLLAGQIRNTFAAKYKEHQSNKNYKGYLHERGIYVLRKTNPPAVLIELANINNPYNHKRILPSGNRQALAKWIFEGLTKNVRSTRSDQIIASS